MKKESWGRSENLRDPSLSATQVDTSHQGSIEPRPDGLFLRPALVSQIVYLRFERGPSLGHTWVRFWGDS